VEVGFGAGAVVVPAVMAYVDLTSRGTIPVPATGPVAWSALDNLPCCRTIEWTGSDRGVIDEVVARHIQFLAFGQKP
jgi:hypothetical protein